MGSIALRGVPRRTMEPPSNFMPKLIVGFITYNNVTAKYLPDFLSSLHAALPVDSKILAIDNSENADNDNVKFISTHEPDIVLQHAGKNLGFGKAFNLMIAQALKLGADYFLAINPDTQIDVAALKLMMKKLDEQPKLGSVAPKILQWDFINKKLLKNIDSCGIVLQPGLRFIDLGQGQPDNGQYDNTKILGPSGAAAMYRLSAMQAIKDEHGFFDERMFMYKEDCDLVYRLSLAGWQSALVSQAIIYHDRTVTAHGQSLLAAVANQKNKSLRVQNWSLDNQRLIWKKYWKRQSVGNKLVILFYFVLGWMWEKARIKN